MALSLAKAAPLKPEIKLAQALSEFEAVLPDDQKSKLRTYRGQSPPNPTDVMRFTAEIDRDSNRNRKSRQCVGTRLTNVLHAVQQFSTVVDAVVGSSQSQIAGAIWGVVKISLQLASAISSYFDQLSTLFMRLGLTCPRYQDFGLLYPASTRLQRALCDYFIVIVRLCKQAVLFLKKCFWSQLSSSILNPFDSEFGGFQQHLESLASAIRDEVSLASIQAQRTEAKEMSSFRALAKNFSDTSTLEVRTWRKKKAELRFLDACSAYNHEISWKQARKQGNTNWICYDEGYKQWKREQVSSTLWCTGILGSGKTVLSANVVEDVKITTPAAVAYFFCRHDEAKSLETRTIIGSIARQIFGYIISDTVDALAEIRPGTLGTDQILDYLEKLLPSNSRKYFIIIDGLDECQEKETELLLQCLKQLLKSKHVFQVYCSSRPDTFHRAHTLLEPQWNVSMPRTSADMEGYVEDTLVKHLESGRFSVGDPKIILTIQNALLENAHGMFLWVAFQIDSICSRKTDEAILTALEDLPKDLPDTFNRILRNLQNSSAADPRFCRNVFDLLATAQRPLTLDELREAVSVQPPKTLWDTSKLVNDMLSSLLDSCGSLVAVDEERLTVHFAHHSVKQHLLSKPMDSDMKKYHINMKEADLYTGCIIVTYLNFGVFDQQLARAESTTVRQVNVPQVNSYPSAILAGSLPRSNIANRLAVRLLKSKGRSRLDPHSQLKIAGAIGGSKEHAQPVHSFLPYAQEYWLFHTKAFKLAGEEYILWKYLIDQEVKTVELPWAPKRWNEFGDEYMKWIIQDAHWALIDRSLVEFTNDSTHYTATKLLLDFLEKSARVLNAQNISFGAALYVASYLNNRAVVLLLLEKGVDIDAVNGEHGTALQAASYNGHEEIARLLLENRADVNRTSEGFGTALQTASATGQIEVVKIFLKNGASIDADGRHYGTALQAASTKGYEEVARFLLANGANVNAHSKSAHRTALQTASFNGHKEMVRLLLENGANIDEDGPRGNALHLASGNGYHEVVGFLLDNGADIKPVSGFDRTALEVASANGHVMTAKILLERGADVNAHCQSDYGTALKTASFNGHSEMVRLLLKSGANVNAKGGSYYGNALQAAARSTQTGVMRLLLDNGADINAVIEWDKTPWEAASKKDRKEMVRLLLEWGRRQ